MRLHQRIIRPNSALAVLGTILGVLCGCAVVGPTSISMGRADYNEAINKTDDAQMLMSIVRGRYGETFSLLAVTGVAANVRFGTKTRTRVHSIKVILERGDPETDTQLHDGQRW